MAAVGVLFAAYIFNVRGTATFLDSSFSSLNGDLQSHSTSVVQLTLDCVPYLGMGIAALVVFAMGLALILRVRTAQKVVLVKQRPRIMPNQFASLSARHLP